MAQTCERRPGGGGAAAHSLAGDGSQHSGKKPICHPFGADVAIAPDRNAAAAWVAERFGIRPALAATIADAGRARQAIAMTPLDADRAEIDRFYGAVFRHAEPGGYVSLRTFEHDPAMPPVEIRAVPIDGEGLAPVVAQVAGGASRAARHPRPAVFAPPPCTFANARHAARQGRLSFSRPPWTMAVHVAPPTPRPEGRF